MFQETKMAFGRLRYDVQMALCELFISWAIKIAPNRYVPSYVTAAIDAYYRRGRFADISARIASNSPTIDR